MSIWQKRVLNPSPSVFPTKSPVFSELYTVREVDLVSERIETLVSFQECPPPPSNCQYSYNVHKVQIPISVLMFSGLEDDSVVINWLSFQGTRVWFSAPTWWHTTVYHSTPRDEIPPFKPWSFQTQAPPSKGTRHMWYTGIDVGKTPRHMKQNRTKLSFPPASPSSRERWEDLQWAELGWVCLLPLSTLFTHPDCVPRSWDCRGTPLTGHYNPLWVTSLVGTAA